MPADRATKPKTPQQPPEDRHTDRCRTCHREDCDGRLAETELDVTTGRDLTLGLVRRGIIAENVRRVVIDASDAPIDVYVEHYGGTQTSQLAVRLLVERSKARPEKKNDAKVQDETAGS